jgi:septum formation protein
MEFDVLPSDKPESDCTETDPAKRAVALARMKAEDIAQANEDAYVLGCDTLVVAADGTLLEKPVDAEDARRMLRMHSGSVSVVHSALCLKAPDGEVFEGLDSSSVHFKELSDDDISWWIGTGLWNDRSGSFQIDGPGQLMIKRIEGDFSGIVGLPIFLLGELCKKAGYKVSP